MAGMTLYTPPDFWRSYPVLIAAEYSEFPLTVVSGGPAFHPETGRVTPYFLNRFPLGKVPVLVADSGFCLQESNAAAYYVSSNVLRGSSRQESVLVQQWINFAESELIPPVAAWVFPTLGIVKCSELVTERAKADVKKVLLLMNDHLHVRTYLVGEHITLADITLVCAMLGLYKQVLVPSLWEEYSDVNRWFTTCVNQPPFQKVLGVVKLCEQVVQCPARKSLETPTEQDVTKEAATVGICLMGAPKESRSNTEEVGPVDSEMSKEMAAIEVSMVGPSIADRPVGEADDVDPPLKVRPAKVECLLDASEEELSVVCAAKEDRTNEVRLVVAPREVRTTKEEGGRIHVFKEEATSVSVDVCEELVCITGPSSEPAKEEAAVWVQVEGVSEETKSIEASNVLAAKVDSSAEGKATTEVSVTSSLGEDRPGKVEVSLVGDLKEEAVAGVCTAGASEEGGVVEVSQLDAPQWNRGVEEAAMVKVRLVDASQKGSSVAVQVVDASKPGRPSKEEIGIMGASKDWLAKEEAMGEVCMAGSLNEARAVTLRTLDPSKKDEPCKQEATSEVGTSKEDKPTNVEVGLLDTLQEEVHKVDAPVEYGSVAVSVVNAPKGDQTTESGTVDPSQADKLAAEETMGASGECGDGWDPTQSPERLKAKDPFACLPKSAFILDEFKWKYSNEDISSVALPYFWDHFDKEGWSVWYMEYKHPGELSLVALSSNLITGMFQRLDGLRQHSFASVILFGTDGDSSISGIWILRGRQLASELNEDRQAIEMYSWKKLDVDTDECKTLVNEYFALDGTFRHVGKPFNQGKIFK
ncbi:elongation factor 1-gamma-like [Heptranchias perlo]|uniref:elongation factor 1-gamma-like n=1 Tax=Heptranchias perlo TaxID=212740 RepID=UPI00355A20FD